MLKTNNVTNLDIKYSSTDLIPLIILLVACVFMPVDVFARDLSGGITSVGSEISRVMMILGPIMLIIAGV
jgi:hypothetical protein